MNKGKILFLNGLTSSGKTTLTDALQTQSEEFYYAAAVDQFEFMIGKKYLEQDYWKYISEVILLMYHTARLFSDLGKNVIIDGMLLEKKELAPHLETVLSLFAGYPLYFIELVCPLELCRARNVQRGDRKEEDSDWQVELMAKDVPYSCSVDTQRHSPRQCAQMILQAVSATTTA